MNKLKLNQLLASTQILGGQFRALVKDYIVFFKNKESHFTGSMSVYVKQEGTIDEPKRTYNNPVTTTVEEKLKWFEDTASKFIDMLFKQEATNASGTVKAELFVEGKSWGMFSSLELLRLQSLLKGEYGELSVLYGTLPTREESKLWKPTSADQYEGRAIYETEPVTSPNRTTRKDAQIVFNPNIKEGQPDNNPQIVYNDVPEILGEQTTQDFTGKMSARERAEILRRKTTLMEAVTDALQRANQAEAVDSDMTAEKIFGYLHKGNA